MQFIFDEKVKELGLSGAYFIISGMCNQASYPEFEELKSRIIAKVLPGLSEEGIKQDEMLQGFWELHTKTGKPGKDHVPSPENLLRFLLEKKRLPSINLIVDIYNLVSVTTKLALGAHNTAFISGNVSLRFTHGDEYFLPLGYKEPKPAGTGVYSYIDDANDILCWMEVRQVEKTRVTLNTTECFYIVQGNAPTSTEYI